VCNGVWRLAARIPRQAIWKRDSRGAALEPPGDIVEVELCFSCLDVHGLQGF